MSEPKRITNDSEYRAALERISELGDEADPELVGEMEAWAKFVDDYEERRREGEPADV